MARLRLLVLLGLIAWAQTSHAARIALVIGNAAYKENPLKNPVNDARDISAKLKELGFTVITKENLKRKEIPSTLKAFRGQIKPGDDVLFFYAGHGLQVKGVNYLPAVDADISSEDEVDMESLSLNKLLELLDESKAAVKLVFLDACRNNPYARSFRSADRGLSRIGDIAPSGTLISFATKPGSVAADGKGKNGLYTEQLLKHISAPNTPIELVIKNVVRDVRRQSNGAQDPWMEGSLDGDFYFKTADPQATSVSLAYKAPPAILPGKAGVDFADIEKAEQQEAAARQQWADWQKRMQADFDKAAQFNGAAALAAWNRFLQTYTSDNPYSRDDERLRLGAQKRLRQAQDAPLTDASASDQLIAGRYQPLGDGAEIKDMQTGLIWQRCAVGMSWNGRTCTGEYRTFTFDQAQGLTDKTWRVPNKDELAGIVDRSRQKPTINPQAFPSTPSTWFWSSSPSAGHFDSALYVSFNDGGVGSYVRGSHLLVRLVRSGQ